MVVLHDPPSLLSIPIVFIEKLDHLKTSIS